MLKLDFDRLAITSFEIPSQQAETERYDSCTPQCNGTDTGNTFQDQQYV